MNRRTFLTSTAAASLTHALNAASPKQFKIWMFGCAHIGNDIQHGFHTLREAAKDAETVGFDIGVNLGDISGEQGLPTGS